jgi:hypothetical protein
LREDCAAFFPLSAAVALCNGMATMLKPTSDILVVTLPGQAPDFYGRCPD